MDVDIVRALLPLVDDPDREVRAAAKDALGQAREKEALLEVVQHADEEIRSQAQGALQEALVWEEGQRREAAKPWYQRTIESANTSTELGAIADALSAAERESGVGAELLKWLVPLYQSAAHSTYWSGPAYQDPQYDAWLKVRQGAARVIAKLAGAPDARPILSDLRAQMYDQMMSYDPMTDDSAYQISSRGAYQQTVEMIDKVLS